jgi:hypothetical protein
MLMFKHLLGRALPQHNKDCHDRGMGVHHNTWEAACL